MTCLVSLDLGSNSFRILKALPQENPPYYRALNMERVIVRMGESVTETGKFSKSAIERGLMALGKFREVIDNCHYRAVATGVFRESQNSGEFVKRAKEELNIDIEIIPASEEAFLSYRGAVNEIGSEGEALFIDIGGGSTEIALEDGNTFFYESLPWGIVKLWDKFSPGMPADPEVTRSMEQFLVTKMEEVYNKFKGHFFREVVLTGGTVTTLIMLELGLREYKREILNKFIVTKSLVNRWLSRIALMSFEERRTLAGMEKGREDVIFTGLLIMKVFMETFGVGEGYNSEGGLLEGVLLSLKERRRNA